MTVRGPNFSPLLLLLLPSLCYFDGRDDVDDDYGHVFGLL